MGKVDVQEWERKAKGRKDGEEGGAVEKNGMAERVEEERESKGRR